MELYIKYRNIANNVANVSSNSKYKSDFGKQTSRCRF